MVHPNIVHLTKKARIHKVYKKMPRFPNSTNSSSSNNQNRYNPYSNNIRSLGSKSSNNTNSTITTSGRSLSTSQQVQPSPTNNLNIRYNSSGYRQFNSDNGLGWKFTHRRVAEKKIGREIMPSEHVHHINKNKTDNRYGNLAVLDGAIHQHLHNSKSEKTACFRCGRTSHHASQCFANSDVFGRSVVGSGPRTSYYSDDESSSDDDSYGGCSRCGRSSHTSSNCYARSDRYGNEL